MFYSFGEYGKDQPIFSDGWLLLSKIAYVVSDFPDKDFKFQKVILKGRIYEGIRWNSFFGVHNFQVNGEGEFKELRQEYYNKMCEGMVKELENLLLKVLKIKLGKS